MPLSDSESQCSKLFEHLNYCLEILKKNLDQQKIEILKRVEHDVDIIEKYIKSIMKYNDKRETEFEKLVKELKKKEQELELQNTKILELSCRITKKEEEINKKEEIIEHLKYSKKIDASYVSSILFNENSSLMRELYKGDKGEARYADGNSIDGLSLSEYSEHGAGEERDKLETQNTLTTTKSEIKTRHAKTSEFYCGVINEEEEGMDERNLDREGERELHKASSLIFNE